MDDDFSLYSWGANSHGQLGHGDIEDEEVLLPRQVNVSSANMQLGELIKIVGGAGHTLFLDERGRVYSCGWNDKGQAGLPSSMSCRSIQRIERLQHEKIVDVACGWDSSMALTAEGDVFVWGSNSHGQLGLRGLDKVCWEPKRLQLDGRKFTRISMGLRHSAVVSTKGELLVSGASNKSQLGIDLKGASSSESFLTVSDLLPVREVACGQHHTVAITRNNELFAWGDNKHAQLGINPDERRVVRIPTKVENGTEINDTSKIYCGWTHTCLHSSKTVYCWGRNTYGQLAQSKEAVAVYDWKASLALNGDIRALSVGSQHNVALSANGAVLTWGWNEHGNCGTGNTQDVFSPIEIKLTTRSLGELGASLIGTGAGHSFALFHIR